MLINPWKEKYDDLLVKYLKTLEELKAAKQQMLRNKYGFPQVDKIKIDIWSLNDEGTDYVAAYTKNGVFSRPFDIDYTKNLDKETFTDEEIQTIKDWINLMKVMYSEVEISGDIDDVLNKKAPGCLYPAFR